MAIRTAVCAAVSAVVVRPGTAAKVMLSAESQTLIVTLVPVNANRWKYAWAPNDSDPPVSNELDGPAAVAEPSTRRAGVSCTPHSRPNPFACVLTGKVSDPSVALVGS